MLFDAVEDSYFPTCYYIGVTDLMVFVLGLVIQSLHLMSLGRLLKDHLSKTIQPGLNAVFLSSLQHIQNNVIPEFIF